MHIDWNWAELDKKTNIVYARTKLYQADLWGRWRFFYQSYFTKLIQTKFSLGHDCTSLRDFEKINPIWKWIRLRLIVRDDQDDCDDWL